MMKQQLQAQFGDRIKQHVDLSPYFTMKMHATAEYYLEAQSISDWQEIVKITSAHHIPLLILGGGSNLAVLSKTIPGLVVRNRYMKKEIVEDTSDHVDLLISSGYPMSHVVKETTEAGLSGFEYHLGLPGTLGGAIYMNSKWTKPLSYIGDHLIRGTIMDSAGAVRTEQREYFKFAYDYSSLQGTHEVFLEGVFRLEKNDPALLQQRSQEALAYRKQTQPFGVATGGCFFQNISEEDQKKNHLETSSVGYLIDQLGLKGHQIGSFVISDKHANFIINTGDGKPEDLAELVSFIKTKVKEKYGVSLKEEVKII